MARRPAAKKILKPKAPKLGKRAIASINLQHHGPEPSKNDLKGWTWSEAYTWYNYNCDVKQAKDFLVEYLKEIEHPDAPEISKIDDRIVYGYGSTSCWMARMASNGYSLKDRRKEFFDKQLDVIKKKSVEVILEKEENKEVLSSISSKSSAQAARKADEQYFDAVDFFDDEFLNETYSSPLAYFNGISASRELIQRIYNKYKPYLREMQELLSPGPKDPQIIEYYAHWKVSKAKKQLAYAQQLINDCEKFVEAKKAVRKPRKKKVIPIDKKLSNFNYQKNDINLSLVSFNPAKIFDSQEIWIYNTKYHIVTVLRTDDKFDVKGTTIVGFNPETSVSKRIGAKKAHTFVQSVLTTTKPGLKNLLSSISGSDQEVKGRTGENTILLRFIS